ncbi:MAG TPA: hypothetical protein VEJ46_00480 [Candidatus Acidoferrum sp.]|nr:hypothetical protein [Candidatus Acidoferrum sp.]
MVHSNLKQRVLPRAWARTIGELFAVIAILSLSARTQDAPPSRPTGVPPGAVWAGGPDGGNYIYCLAPQNGVNACTVYFANGDVYMTGMYHLERTDKAAPPEMLQFRFADGEHIYLKSGDVLAAVVRAAPSNIPKTAQRTKNGVYVACSRLDRITLQCHAFDSAGREIGSGRYRANDRSTLPSAITIFSFSKSSIILSDGKVLEHAEHLTSN